MALNTLKCYHLTPLNLKGSEKKVDSSSSNSNSNSSISSSSSSYCSCGNDANSQSTLSRASALDDAKPDTLAKQ